MKIGFWVLGWAISLTAAETEAVAAEEFWSVNDVSYLYPLPNANHPGLTADKEGPRGVLLPEEVQGKLAPAVRSYDASSERSRLRVVGVRVDPCAVLDQVTDCFPEVRIVWQPLKAGTSLPQYDDGGFHSFYRLTAAEMRALIAELATLKRQNLRKGIRTTGRPLDVHPAFQGSNRKSFEEALSRLWLKYCGASNLFQMTVMRLEAGLEWWHFVGLRKISGKWETLTIPRTNSITQDLFNETMEFQENTRELAKKMKASMLPGYDGPQSLAESIRGYHEPQESNLPVFRKALSDGHAIENPQRFNTVTMDCLHCHLATPTRYYISTHFPVTTWMGRFGAEKYRPENAWLSQLENATLGGRSTKILRAFGYFLEKPAINARVIHESIEVAQRLQKHSPFSR